MLRSEFENSFRNPITGEPYGASRHTLRWISQLGLSDYDGLPIKDSPEVFEKYGPPNPHPTFNLISNSGDHEHDQAALYLAQQALQNGKVYFQGGVLPPELAKQAHQILRDHLEGNNKSAAWTEERPNVPSEWDLIDERNRDPFSPEWERKICPHCGSVMNKHDYCTNCWRRVAELRDPLTEPEWMANDSDIKDLNIQDLCAKCGRPDCEHVMNHVHPPVHPKDMQVNPMWQENSSPIDTHGTGY